MDTGTIIRNIIKEVLLIDNSRRNRVNEVVLKASDWLLPSKLIDNALTVLGYNVSERPIHIYTPCIEDASGSKLSKTMISRGNYSRILGELAKPEELFLKDSKFREKLFYFVTDTLSQGNRFYRNYTLDAIKPIFFPTDNLKNMEEM